MDERGWLIEANGSYWDGRGVGPDGFHDDPNQAVRFARFEDAERVKYHVLGQWAFALRSTEHSWPAP